MTPTYFEPKGEKAVAHMQLPQIITQFKSRSRFSSWSRDLQAGAYSCIRPRKGVVSQEAVGGCCDRVRIFWGMWGNGRCRWPSWQEIRVGLAMNESVCLLPDYQTHVAPSFHSSFIAMTMMIWQEQSRLAKSSWRGSEPNWRLLAEDKDRRVCLVLFQVEKGPDRQFARGKA